MLDNPYSVKIFPNVQSEPLLARLEAISSSSTTFYVGEEANLHLTTNSSCRKW